MCLISRSLFPFLCLSAGPSHVFTSCSSFLTWLSKIHSITLARTSDNNYSDVNLCESRGCDCPGHQILSPVKKDSRETIAECVIKSSRWMFSTEQSRALPSPLEMLSQLADAVLVSDRFISKLWILRDPVSVKWKSDYRYQLQASTCSNIGVPIHTQSKHAYIYTCPWHTHENDPQTSSSSSCWCGKRDCFHLYAMDRGRVHRKMIVTLGQCVPGHESQFYYTLLSPITSLAFYCQYQ